VLPDQGTFPTAAARHVVTQEFQRWHLDLMRCCLLPSQHSSDLSDHQLFFSQSRRRSSQHFCFPTTDRHSDCQAVKLPSQGGGSRILQKELVPHLFLSPHLAYTFDHVAAPRVQPQQDTSVSRFINKIIPRWSRNLYVTLRRATRTAPHRSLSFR
jgi:hypothetical protein